MKRLGSWLQGASSSKGKPIPYIEKSPIVSFKYNFAFHVGFFLCAWSWCVPLQFMERHYVLIGIQYCFNHIYMGVFVHAKSLQSCPALCNPLDCSPLGSTVHGILQEEQSRLSCPTPSRLPEPGIKPTCLMSRQAGSLPLAPPGKPICMGMFLHTQFYSTRLFVSILITVALQHILVQDKARSTNKLCNCLGLFWPFL